MMLACFALARGATRQEAICGANRCAARAARAAMRYRTAVGRVQRACCDLCEYMQTMRRVYLSVVPVWYVPLLLDIMLRVFPISSSVSCDMSRRELRADLRFVFLLFPINRAVLNVFRLLKATSLSNFPVSSRIGAQCSREFSFNS